MKIEYNAKIVSVCLQNLIACIESYTKKDRFQQAEIETFKAKIDNLVTSRLVQRLLYAEGKCYWMATWQLGRQ